MEFEYDPAKSEKNAQERGLPFDAAADFEFETALIAQDTRKAYPESRFQALGLLNGRVHVLVFAETKGGVRIISLRRANKREVGRYDQET